MNKRDVYLVAGVSAAIFVAALIGIGTAQATAEAAKAPVSWSMNATVIEACSCSMFCPCYFSTKPAPGEAGAHAGHGGGQHYCRFNMAYKVNRGKHGDVDLAGAKFWIAGDLGDDFGDGETEWAEVTFDPAVTKEQRAGLAAILLGPVYPWKWKSFTVGADAPVEWTATKEKAVAKLGGGEHGEILLVQNPTAMSTAEPTVIKNLKYFGAPRNEGFVLMPSQLETYKRGENKFEYKGTNGFMITYDISSKDVK